MTEIARSVSPPAKRAAHLVSVTAGRLTSRARMLPGVLIVGAQRSGTTSMYRTLSQHPAVLKAVLHKGVHYFDMNYDRGPGWYRAHFPLTAAGRRAGRATGSAALTFESSPYYMFHPLAADRIARDLPEVKLIALVRDPVERAYSAHAHELARGYETEPFERALELEDERLRGEAKRMLDDPSYLSHSHQHQAYLARGRYAEQLERLESLVGTDRLHVIDSGDFFTEPEPVYDAALGFLGLRSLGYPEFERHNARPRSPMPEALRARLDEYFSPFD
ncbi:MAG TPA: sulfotransferase, partial [Streptosporangiaceae bacterium]